MHDWEARPCEEYYETPSKHPTLMANGVTDIFLHQPVNLRLSILSPYPFHLLKNIIIGHALETLEMSLAGDASRLHQRQSKEEGGTAKISDGDCSQHFDADPEN